MTGIDQGKDHSTVFGSTRRISIQETLPVNVERFIATLCTVVAELRHRYRYFLSCPDLE